MQVLGGSASEVLECEFYCDFIGSIREELMSGCSTDTDCPLGSPPSFFEMRPSPGSFCATEAKYALFSSCTVPASKKQEFSDAVQELLSASDESSCSSTLVESLDTSDDGSPPLVLPSPNPSATVDCSERMDCRFACFNHGFAIVHSGNRVSLSSKYIGVCDCSLRGIFNGTIEFEPALVVRASNVLGDTVMVSPVVSFNQLMLTLNSSIGVCTFVQNVGQGSIFGLPTAAPARPSKSGSLDFSGYDAALSGLAGNTQRTQRRRLQQSLDADAQAFSQDCPQQTADCRYACLEQGFASEAFGATMLLLPKYSGDCDCSQVIAKTSSFGDPVLVGEVLEVDGTSLNFIFTDSFFASFLPIDTNSPTPTGFTSATLKPFGEGMILNVGGQCSYRIGVAAGTLAMIRKSLAEIRSTAEAFSTARISLVLHDGSLPSPRSNITLCTDVRDCQFLCLFSGQTKVTDSLDIIGATSDKSCACDTHSGRVSTDNQKVIGDGWTIEADPTNNALFYSWSQTTNCSGYLHVRGGVFLGIPRSSTRNKVASLYIEPENATGSDRAELLPISVETAEAAAMSVTVVVAVAVSVEVTAAVGASVASSAGLAAAEGAAAGAAGGAVSGPSGSLSLISQVSARSHLQPPTTKHRRHKAANAQSLCARSADIAGGVWARCRRWLSFRALAVPLCSPRARG